MSLSSWRESAESLFVDRSPGKCSWEGGEYTAASSTARICISRWNAGVVSGKRRGWKSGSMTRRVREVERRVQRKRGKIFIERYGE